MKKLITISLNGISTRGSNLYNKRFGKLLVIKPVKRTFYGVEWLCKCDCGRETNLLSSKLTGGRIDHCGCSPKGGRRFYEMVGKKYGRLMVLSYDKTLSKAKYRMVRCKCDCGNELDVRCSSLLHGRTKSCGCLQKELSHKDNPKRRLPNSGGPKNTLYSRYKNDARRRGYKFNISKKFTTALMQQDCFYCGSKPNQIFGSKRKDGGYVYIGIDRVDNTLGYTEENCVPCCKVCNRMKLDLPLREFLDHIHRIDKKMDGVITTLRIVI